MDYQVSVTCNDLAEWHLRVKAIAQAHHGHATEKSLLAIANEIYAQVPSEWWASQPPPLDNRVRSET